MENAIPKKPAWLQPVIPLENATTRTTTTDDSRTYVSMYLKARAGSGDNGETYKKRFFLFDDGTPQEWVEVLEDLDELWRQNSVTNGADRAATVQMILRNDALNEFTTALSEETTTLVATRTTTSPATVANVTKALGAVTMAVFPHRALETQKSWMQRGMKKPLTMTTRKLAAAVVRLNNLLPRFPGGNEESKFSDKELVGLLEQAIPARWRAKFDLDGYIPTDHDRAKFVTACEAIERNEPTSTATKGTKTKAKKGGKSKNDDKAAAEQSSGPTKKMYYCTEHGKNPTHNTAQCRVIQNRAKGGQNSNDKPNNSGASFSRRTFRKEVNAIALAKKASKRKVLDLYAAAIKAEREKLGRLKQKAKSKKNANKRADSSSDSYESDSDLSIEVIDVVESPTKKAKKTSSAPTATGTKTNPAPAKPGEKTKVVPAKPGQKTNIVPAKSTDGGKNPATLHLHKGLARLEQQKSEGQKPPASPTATSLRSIMKEPRSLRALEEGEKSPDSTGDGKTPPKKASFASSTVGGQTVVKKVVSNKKEKPIPDPVKMTGKRKAEERPFKERISHLGASSKDLRRRKKSGMIGRISGSSSSERDSDESISV